MLAGAGMIFTSLAGKTFIKFYRLIKTQGSVLAKAGNFNAYKGGFLSPMTA